MTVKLAMYKGKGGIGNAAIRWWTDSEYSHCELVVEGWCYSSSLMDGGVRAKKIDLDSGHWDVYELPWANATDILHYFHKSDPYKYSIVSLVTSQVFNRNKKEDTKQFCSQWCANALGLPSSSTYSPKTLLALCEYITKLK